MCICFWWLQVDQVTVEHLQQHFVNFAMNDNLGQISTWLLAQADALGPDSPPCQELAALHSTAVDFPKTGKPAELDFGLVSPACNATSTFDWLAATCPFVRCWPTRAVYAGWTSTACTADCQRHSSGSTRYLLPPVRTSTAVCTL
jgi:hypothetical protein